MPICDDVLTPDPPEDEWTTPDIKIVQFVCNEHLKALIELHGENVFWEKESKGDICDFWGKLWDEIGE